MSPTRIHADEIGIDVSMARRLVAEQVPEYAALPLRRVASGGTDNAVFRLGDDLAIRMPLHPGAVGGLLKEVRWLPVVATTDAPRPGSEGFVRGLPLVGRDAYFRAALAQCQGLVDTQRVAEVWDDALTVPAWDGPPVWLHADLLPSNVLVRDGRVAGVLDFGAMATGDPAYDVTPAWHLFDRVQPVCVLRDRRRGRRDVPPCPWARRIWRCHRPAVLPALQPVDGGDSSPGIEEVLSDLV